MKEIEVIWKRMYTHTYRQCGFSRVYDVIFVNILWPNGALGPRDGKLPHEGSGGGG